MKHAFDKFNFKETQPYLDGPALWYEVGWKDEESQVTWPDQS